MVIDFLQSVTYTDAIRDIRSWFDDINTNDFLKRLKINKKNLLAILDVVIKNSASFMDDRENFCITATFPMGKKVGTAESMKRSLSWEQEEELKSLVFKMAVGLRKGEK